MAKYACVRHDHSLELVSQPRGTSDFMSGEASTTVPGTLQDWSRMVGDMLFATSNSRPQNIWKVALLDTGMSVCSKSFDSFYAPWSVDQVSPEHPVELVELHSSSDRRPCSLCSKGLRLWQHTGTPRKCSQSRSAF